MESTHPATTSTKKPPFRFVPHEFLSYLNKKNIIDVQLNDNTETPMTVVFSDIHSFTDPSEVMTPRALLLGSIMCSFPRRKVA